MFEDINKMEEEIKEFRQNVLASSQLVEGINNLVTETQNQQALMRQVSSDYQNTIQGITDGAIGRIEQMESDSIAEMKLMVSKNISDAATQISVANKEYIDELNKADELIKSMQADLSDKYNQYSDRMEGVNLQELEKTCSELKKSLELKTTIAIAGVIVVIVLEIVQPFIK